MDGSSYILRICSHHVMSLSFLRVDIVHCDCEVFVVELCCRWTSWCWKTRALLGRLYRTLESPRCAAVQAEAEASAYTSANLPFLPRAKGQCIMIIIDAIHYLQLEVVKLAIQYNAQSGTTAKTSRLTTLQPKCER